MNVQSSIIHNNPKVEQLKCPSNDEWKNKMWNMYTVEHYSAIKKNEVLIHAITQMYFENIMLNERS